MTHIRASRTPLAMLCGPSSSPGLEVESADRNAADEGTAAHETLAKFITNGLDAEVITEAASRNRVDIDEVRPLVYMAWGLWRQIEGFFPHPLLETPLSFIDDDNLLTLTGHTDLLSTPAALEQPEVRIHDWKFGRLEGDHDDQLTAYAFLALHRYPEAERAYVSIGRVRERSLDARYISRTEAWAWYAGLLERMNDTTYRPGRHCQYCPRGAVCEAKEALLQRSLTLVRPQHLSQLPADPVARTRALEEVLVAARLVSRAAEDAQDMVRAEVGAAGGQLGNLRLIAQDQRKIVMPQALPVLRDVLGDDLDQLLKIGKGDVEKAVRDRAPPRGKGKAVEELMGRLDDAGALQINTVERLEIRKPEPTLIEV